MCLGLTASDFQQLTYDTQHTICAHTWNDLVECLKTKKSSILYAIQKIRHLVVKNIYMTGYKRLSLPTKVYKIRKECHASRRNK